MPRLLSTANALVVMAGMAAGGTAAASAPFQVLEPDNFVLSLHQVVSGVPTPPGTIHLRNITPGPASGDVRFGGAGFSLTGNTPISVAPGQDVSWGISCLTDEPGGAAAFFDLDWCGADCNDSSGLLTINVECSPPVMRLSAPRVDFPATLRGHKAQHTITITNLTSGPVSWPAAITGAGFAIVGGSTVALAAGASTDVTVEFHPTSTGDLTGTLAIGTAGDADHFDVPLAGTASAPMVTADTTLAFGDVAVGHTAEAMLAIHNLDTTHSFQIGQIAIDDAAFTAAPPTDPTLAPGATVMVAVQFTPADSAARSAQLSVTLDGDSAPIATVDVTGQGIADSGGGGCHATGGAGPALALALLALVALRRRRGRYSIM